MFGNPRCCFWASKDGHFCQKWQFSDTKNGTLDTQTKNKDYFYNYNIPKNDGIATSFKLCDSLLTCSNTGYKIFKISIYWLSVFFADISFLSNYQTQVYLGSDPWSESLKLQHLCADLTDVTLTDEDTNPILTDNANRAIQGNVAM